MAEHVSPGVYTFEIDLSLYIPILSTCICGVVGVAPKGPIDEARLTTSWSQYATLYGDTHPDYLMSYFAREFFDWGNQLYVTRVCEHDTDGNFLATHSYLNHFSNTQYQISGEVVGAVQAGNAGTYNFMLDTTPVVVGSVLIQDTPVTTVVTNESTGQDLEVGVTAYSFLINNTPVIPGTVSFSDDYSVPHEVFTDDGRGVIAGNGAIPGTGTIDYQTGVVVFNFGIAPTVNSPNVGSVVRVSYNYYSATTETFQDSLDYPGTLVGSEGGYGTIDYSTGNFAVTFNSAPSASGNLKADYRYRTPTDGILQFVSIWPGDGGNDLAVLITDGNPYINQYGTTVLPVSRGGTSFRVVVYDQGQRTSIEFDNLSMFSSSKNIQGSSRFVEDVIGNKVFGEYGFADSVTNNYIAAKLIKTPLSIELESTNVNSDNGVDTYEFTLEELPIVPGTLEISLAGFEELETFYDDVDNPGILFGTASPAGSGEINYDTGFCRITFGTAPTVSGEIVANYNYSRIENPYVGTNGYMLYMHPERYSITPEFDYTRYQGIDAIDDIKDGDVIGEFDSETNTRTGLMSFKDPENIDVNLIAAPGFASAAIASALITIAEYRQDTMAIIDPPMGLSVQQVIDWHNGSLRSGVGTDNTPGDFIGYTTAALNSSYAAMYYPWGKLYDNRNFTYVWVPPSCGGIRAITKNDTVADVGKAPAGYNRGDLVSWLDVEYSPNLNERDMLYGNGNAINPITKVPKVGIVVLGERTLSRKPSKTDRIHVRRMLLYMRKVIATASRYLLFEPHDWKTWLQFKLLVSPYLRYEVSRRNLYRFEIVCDETTNTPYMIDTSTMVGNIYIWPESAVERLMINFVVTPTSISFEEAYELVQGEHSDVTFGYTTNAAKNYSSRLNTSS